MLVDHTAEGLGGKKSDQGQGGLDWFGHSVQRLGVYSFVTST